MSQTLCLDFIEMLIVHLKQAAHGRNPSMRRGRRLAGDFRKSLQAPQCFQWEIYGILYIFIYDSLFMVDSSFSVPILFKYCFFLREAEVSGQSETQDKKHVSRVTGSESPQWAIPIDQLVYLPHEIWLEPLIVQFCT